MLYRIFRDFFRFFFRHTGGLEVTGQENVPTTGPVIIAANHVSNLDPLILGSGVQRQIHYIAKEELFKIPLIGQLLHAWGAFPVKRGRGDREAIATSLTVLKEAHVLGIFIEGGRNKSHSDQMLRPHPGAAMMAIHSQAPVVPVALINTDRLFRKAVVRIGKPLYFSEPAEVSKKDLYAQIGETIVDAITALKAGKDKA